MATVASGPPGIEVPWEWSGGITLNDLADREKHIKIVEAPGLHSLPDAEDNRKPNTATRGEHALPSYVRGKLVVVEGLIRARRLDDMRVLSTSMRRAFRQRNVLGVMVLAGDPEWMFAARVAQLDIPEKQVASPTATWPHTREFTLGLRMTDARFYTPLVPLEDGDDDGVSATVDLSDSATDTPPVFEVEVADEQVTITNLDLVASDGNDARLRFNGLDTGRTMSVDFLRRTARYTDDGEDAMAKLDVAFSNWWDELMPGLEVGSNELRVDGGAWTVQYRHASE